MSKLTRQQLILQVIENGNVTSQEDLRRALARHSQRGQLPVQNLTGRTGFMAGFQLVHRPKLRNHFANRFQAVRDDAERTDFSVRLSHRSRDGVRVDIKTNKSYLS